jgi:mono/diheme cytochrome c family protein
MAAEAVDRSRRMRRVLLAILILAVVGFAAFWFITRPQTIAASELPPHKTDLENGKVMFFAGGCAGCHAVPKAEDRTRLGGGMALGSPYGTFYAPNISPDPKDGIGTWSEADFVTAMMRGTSPDRRHYFPAFPYPSYQRMRLADVRDMFAFIKTLPPVQGRVRDHDIRFPFNFRLLVGGWKFLYLDGRPFTPDPNQPAEWNRGAYLVNGPGHCAECHSPRNWLGGIIEGKRFAGGPNPEGEGTIPNITQAGIGEYSAQDIEEILATGTNPEGDSVGGSMAAVVRNTSQLPQQDRAAMARYIKSLPPVK